MSTLLEEPAVLKQWEKPSLTVLPISETQDGSGRNADLSFTSS